MATTVVSALHPRPDRAPEEYEKQVKKDHHIKAFKNPAETVVALSLASRKKADTKLPVLILLSVWSGLFISIGGALALTLGGGMQYRSTDHENGTLVLTDFQVIIPMLPKLMFGATFPIALILILLLGGELYTGNTMTMTIGVLTKQVNLVDLAISWIVTWLGNYAGTVIGALAFWGMGTMYNDPWYSFLNAVVQPKVNNNFGVNLLKAIPCNILVNAAIVIANEAEDITGKIVGAWWPIFTFAIAGFEHCIANMFFVTLASFYGIPFNYGTFFWQNLIPVTIGNTIGGAIFMGVIMWYAYYIPGPSSRPKSKDKKKIELKTIN